MKLIMFKGAVETQEYFSFQMAAQFKKLGYEIFFYDLSNPAESQEPLKEFCKTGTTAAVTFNFNGIAGEKYFYSGDKSNFWDEHGIACFNIVVDHPFYYHKFLQYTPKRYYQIDIDKNHVKYMNRYFPDIKCTYIALGGTRLETGEGLVPIKNRKYEVTFTGNYVRPESFERYLYHLDAEYIEFYHSIIDELIAKPSELLETVAERRLKEELGNGLTDEQLKGCYQDMIFIDLWVRFHYRGKVIKELVDNGIKVTICGSGWEQLECEHPENILSVGQVDSKKCLEIISQSKISINVMPWFKDGAHDRIFNSMLNGAVCITDGSKYLEDIFDADKDIVFYKLTELETVSDKVRELLANEDLMAVIANNSHVKALTCQWADRADEINELIKKVL